MGWMQFKEEWLLIESLKYKFSNHIFVSKIRLLGKNNCNLKSPLRWENGEEKHKEIVDSYPIILL